MQQHQRPMRPSLALYHPPHFPGNPGRSGGHLSERNFQGDGLNADAMQALPRDYDLSNQFALPQTLSASAGEWTLARLGMTHVVDMLFGKSHCA